MVGKYSVSYIVGLAVGIVLVFGILIFAIKRFNSDKSMKTKYDERQQLVRGLAYKYSFWTMVFLIAGVIVLDVCGIDLPLQNSVLYFLIILISMMIHTSYCIFNDGYFGINNNPKQYYWFFVFIGLFNVLVGIINCRGGRLLSEGKLDTPAINLFCGLMFVLLGICIVIKKFITKNEDIDEDDEDEE